MGVYHPTLITITMLPNVVCTMRADDIVCHSLISVASSDFVKLQLAIRISMLITVLLSLKCTAAVLLLIAVVCFSQ